MKKSKQLLLITALLFIWELPVIAQQPTDTTYIFRFVPNDDMFYVPWNGNDRSLHQLLNIIGTHHAGRIDRTDVRHRPGYPLLLWERKTAQCRCRHLSGQRRKSSRNCGYRSGSTGRKL